MSDSSPAQESSFFKDTREELEDYLQNRLLLLKMQAAEKTAKLVALLSIGAVLGALGFFMLFFLSIMAGYFFADKTGSLYTGFAIVTGAYLLLFLCLFFLRLRIAALIIDTVIKIFFEKDE
jgi:hypothetical protein